MSNLYTYKRISTKSQIDGVGLDTQINSEQIDNLVSEYKLSAVVELASGIGLSASKGDHLSEEGGLWKFIQACKEGTIPKGSILYVYSLDRLSRLGRFGEAMSKVYSPIISNGVRIYSHTEKTLFTDDQMSEIIISLLNQRAANESKVKSDRNLQFINEAIRLYQEQGIKKPNLTRQPFWICSKTYKVLPDKRPIIEFIIDEFIKGTGYKQIKDKIKENFNFDISVSMVSKIKKNQLNAMIGDKTIAVDKGDIQKDVTLKGFYEPVTSLDKILKIKQGGQLQNIGKNTTIPLLSNQKGLLTCGTCGCSYLSTVINGSIFYYCGGSKKGISDCGRNMIKAEVTERVTLLLITHLLDQYDQSEDKDKLTLVESKLINLKEELTTLTTQYRDTRSPALLSFIVECEQNIKDSEDERDKLLNNALSTSESKTIWNYYKDEIFKNESSTLRNELRPIIRSLLSNISIEKHHTFTKILGDNTPYFIIKVTDIKGNIQTFSTLLKDANVDVDSLQGDNYQDWVIQGTILNELVLRGLASYCMPRKGLHKSKRWETYVTLCKVKLLRSGMYSSNPKLSKIWDGLITTLED